MNGLPDSLAIAIWFTGSICLISIMAYAVDAPVELVHAALVLGVLAGFAEWLVRKGKIR